jgi:hypothetical protein
MEIYKSMKIKLTEREKLTIATVVNAETGSTYEGYDASRIQVDVALNHLENSPTVKTLEPTLAEIVPTVIEKLRNA